MSQTITLQAWGFWAFITLFFVATGWMTWRMEKMRKRISDLNSLNDALLTVVFKGKKSGEAIRIDINDPES